MKLYEYLISKIDLKTTLKEYEIIGDRRKNKHDFMSSLGTDLLIEYYFQTLETKDDEDDCIDYIYANELYQLENYRNHYLIYTLDCMKDNKLYDIIKSKKLLDNHKLKMQIKENYQIIQQLDEKMNK